MVNAGQYVLSAGLLAALVVSLGLSAVLLRRRFLPDWEGAAAHLVDAIVAVALLIWLSELLGVVGLFYASTLVASSLLVAALVAWRLGAAAPARPSAPGGGADLGGHPRRLQLPQGGGAKSATGPAGPEALVPMLIAIGVVALVFAHWGLTAKDALGRGIFNFDSLWYHMPFAVEMAKSHSVTALHYTETVFTNWLYPQNSELVHSVGILLTERDTLSLFVNFGWLAMALLAAWCIGRPYGFGALSVVATGIVLSSHTLVVREPGAAKNDVVAAALLLAAIAVLINAYAKRVAWGVGRPSRGRRDVFRTEHSASAAESTAKIPDPWRGAPPTATGHASQAPALAVAGLATGLAVGTKSTALAMAAGLTVAVVALAPAGRRWATFAWWSLAGVAGGGFWYLRNLIVAGNPLPQVESLGPISLPHPEQLQSGRPDFSIAHYATDTAVWREYFGPGLDHAFGALWPLVVGAAVVGALLALWRGDRAIRWMGGVALFGMVAYLFTPLSASGPEGEPTGFAINIRYAIPALLAGLALLPVGAARWLLPSRSPARGAVAGAPHGGEREASERMGDGHRDRARSRAVWALMGALLAVLVLTNRSDTVLRDPDRLFASALALLLVLVPAGLLLARRRGAPRGAVAAGFAALALALVAIGYPVQRDYLAERFRNEDPARSIPGMSLDSAYRWARKVEDSRIGLAGTTAGFLQYGFYGTDLTNRVRYLGLEAPHAAFEPIPTCDEFRAAVDAAELDYVVTAPFLNFIRPGDPVASPEAGWLRGEPAVTPLDRSGPVVVWRVDGRLDPAGCGPRNVPLRYVPQQPG